MSAQIAAGLQDVDTKPRNAPKKPDPTPLDLELGKAARAFAAAATAVEQHDGARSGPIYAEKLQAWKDRYRELRKVAGDHPGEKI